MSSSATLHLDLATPGAKYGLNAPVAGTIRLTADRSRFCQVLEVGIVFRTQPEDLIGWSDTAPIAEQFKFGEGQEAAFPFLATTPPKPMMLKGEWFVEARATVGRDIVVTRWPITVPLAREKAQRPRVVGTGAGVAKPFEDDDADNPWSEVTSVGAFFSTPGPLFLTAFTLAGWFASLWGAALALDLWNRGIPLGVGLFGLALLMGGTFMTMKLIGRFALGRGLAGALLLAVAGLGLYLTYGNPGWAPLRPEKSLTAAGFSLFRQASAATPAAADLLTHKPLTALLTVLLAVVMAGWVLGQAGRRGRFGLNEVPFLLLMGTLPVLLGWLAVVKLAVAGLAGGGFTPDVRLWALGVGVMGALVVVGRGQWVYYSRFPLAATLLAATIGVCGLLESLNAPAAARGAALALGAGWGACAGLLLWLGNRRALAERVLGAVDVQLEPHNGGQMGRPLRVVIGFTPRQEVRDAHLRVVVVGEDFIRRDMSRQSEEATSETNIVWQQEARQVLVGPVPPGQPVRQELVVQLPSRVPHAGTLSWELRVFIDLPGAADWALVLPLSVVG